MNGALTKTLATRKLSLFILTSLDGKVARSNGEIDWIWTDPVEGPNSDCNYGKFMSSVKYVVTGRKTFDISASFEKLPFAGKQKYVFTRTAGSSRPNDETTYISDDPAQFVRELKTRAPLDNVEDEKIWLLGGAEIFKQLHDADLVDEIILTIQPIIIGAGINLFDGITLETKWNLVSCESWKEGLVQMTYSRSPTPTV
ncbi:Bifunctional deaminase-reductase domain protein [Paramicrosporidium saccamoebae]|uniref:2,5-diamino-6-ribosylamino-4(3H)-pyrimidinone 5'-phosphate reductase n=1 Tax=Paramicrosporidium saccamoebae TaxID=1246581 RepID=A0A2H9TLI0_9FUNG|nr:Bifunctional deaminase-reductase domain protein [Paramicrosporidium saccamoebae]